MKISKPEKDIPLPKHRNAKYPFDQLTPGDSFLITIEDGEDREKVLRKVQCACASKSIYEFETGHKREYVVRRVDKDLRVWRIT